MLFRFALILLAVFLSGTLATEQLQQGDIKASHIQHKRDVTYDAKLEAKHNHLYQRGAGDSEDKPVTEYIPPKNNTKRIFFNTKRHRGRTFVRFLLAKSVNYPESDSVPIVISTPDVSSASYMGPASLTNLMYFFQCLTYGLLNDTNNLSKYNEKPLRTKALLEDADVAR